MYGVDRPAAIRAGYEAAMKERGLGADGPSAGGSILTWLLVLVVGGGIAYGVYELTKPKPKRKKNERSMGIHRSGGRGEFWYGTTPEVDFPIGKAGGPEDARRKAHAIVVSGKKGTRRGEKVTGVYWLEGGKFLSGAWG